MRNGRSLVRVATVLALAGLIVAGCTNDPPPAPPTTSVTSGTTAPTTTAPATTTPSPPTPSPPTPSPPTPSTPTPAASDTDAAKAAAQRYIAAFNDAVKTRSTAEFRKTFITGCKVCTEDADKVDQIVKEGRKVDGGVVSFADVQVESVTPPHVMLSGRAGATKIVIRDASGQVVESHDEFVNQRRILMRFHQGEWLVEGIVS